jgi:tetratricopeptide (TPR) repeat protein
MKILMTIIAAAFLAPQAFAGCGSTAGPGGTGGGGGKESFGVTPNPQAALPAEVSLQDQINGLKQTLAANPEDKAARKDLAIYTHQLALYKNKGASKEAVKLLKAAVEQYPEDAELAAWLGSAHTQTARDAWFPITKLTRVKKGIKQLDAAVKRDPDNFAIRMVRGHNSFNLPKFLKRRETGMADLRLLASWLEEGKPIKVNFPLDERIERRIKADLYYTLARAEAQDKDAEGAAKHYAKAAEAGPDTPWGVAAQKILEESKSAGR